MHPQTINETFYAAKISFRVFLLYPFSRTSFTPIISQKNKLKLIRKHHKGPFTIGALVLNSLGPPDVVLPVLV